MLFKIWTLSYDITMMYLTRKIRRIFAPSISHEISIFLWTNWNHLESSKLSPKWYHQKAFKAWITLLNHSSSYVRTWKHENEKLIMKTNYFFQWSMIQKWHYHAVTRLLLSLSWIKWTHDGNFYCIDCLHSFREIYLSCTKSMWK